MRGHSKYFYFNGVPEYPKVGYDPEVLTKRRDLFGLKKYEVKKLIIMRLEKHEKLESDKPKEYVVIKGQLRQEYLDI